MPPTLLANLVDELDRACGPGLILPLLRLTLLCIIPALITGWAMERLVEPPELPALFNSPLRALTFLLLIAPGLETVGMRYLFMLLGRHIRDPFRVNLVSAILWAAAHVDSASRGLHALWPFYVMGAIFLRLQARSLNRAYAVVILLHALINAIAYGAYLLELKTG